MNFRHVLAALALTSCALVSQTQANIIFQTAEPPPTISTNTYYSANFTQNVADNFQLAAADTIHQVTFWGVYFAGGVVPASPSFSVEVFNDAAGLPGTSHGQSDLSMVSFENTGITDATRPQISLYKFTMDLVTPISIPDTNQYWFQLRGHTSLGNDFYWNFAGPGDGFALQTNPFTQSPGQWQNVPSSDMAFILSNDVTASPVPEPATLSLGLLAMGGLLVASKRRKLA